MVTYLVSYLHICTISRHKIFINKTASFSYTRFWRINATSTANLKITNNFITKHFGKLNKVQKSLKSTKLKSKILKWGEIISYFLKKRRIWFEVIVKSETYEIFYSGTTIVMNKTIRKRSLLLLATHL